jgi:predicted ABC-type ATPase
MIETMQPELWILVGGNGSGKSTFHERFLARRHLPFINADNIARSLWAEEPEKHSYAAALIAEKERFRFLEERVSFCFETVFSHPSKVDFLGSAKAAGYRIRMVYFHLDQVALNKVRVLSRVKAGGHGVPEKKIETRIPRTLQNVKASAGLVDELHLVDNSSADEPFLRIAELRDGDWIRHRAVLPDWAETLIKN